VRSVVFLSESKRKSVPVAEAKEPEKGVKLEKTEDLLKLVPPQFREYAAQYVDLPARVSKLEATMGRILELLETASKRVDEMKGSTGPPTGGGLGALLQLIAPFIGPGESLFDRLAREQALESMAFTRILMRSWLKGMGKGFVKEFENKIQMQPYWRYHILYQAEEIDRKAKMYCKIWEVETVSVIM